jgi:anti-sigma factor ChrR (cupin superfamily)
MIPHESLRDDDRERAALHALGALESDAASLYAAHLAICAMCRGEVESHREAVEAIGRSVVPMEPPQELKARVMHAARAGVAKTAIQTWKQWPSSPVDPGMTLVRSAGDWERSGVDGVEVRRLFVDAANDRLTMLVRMAAGTSYPSHRHGGVEECYVLEGDLYGPDFEMRAGDYQRLEGGSVHGVQGTRGGCLLFIVSSMNDELLPSRP